MPNLPKKNKQKFPGVIFETKAGRYIAYYEHRTDIIANGENEKEAISNLKDAYKAVIGHEKEEESERQGIKLPPGVVPKKFMVKM